jgi:hypothetical protein
MRANVTEDLLSDGALNLGSAETFVDRVLARREAE